MPRFVILEHDHPTLHWDLMLESGNVLRTWRLAEPPNDIGEVAAEASFDHRLIYLEYEGPVSGNRGTVHRWDHGVYHIEEEQGDRLVLWIEGERVKGRMTLASGGRKPTVGRTATGGLRPPLAPESTIVQHEPGAGDGCAGNGSQEQPPEKPPPAS